MQSSERTFTKYYKKRVLQLNLRRWYQDCFEKLYYDFTFEEFEKSIDELNKLEFKSIIISSEKKYQTLKALNLKKYRSSEDKMICILKELGFILKKNYYDY